MKLSPNTLGRLKATTYRQATPFSTGADHLYEVVHEVSASVAFAEVAQLIANYPDPQSWSNEWFWDFYPEGWVEGDSHYYYIEFPGSNPANATHWMRMVPA